MRRTHPKLVACVRIRHLGEPACPYCELGRPALATLGGPPDVVLAADVAYGGSRQHWPLLFTTLKALDAPRTLLAHTTRYAKDDALFFRGLRAAGLTATRLDLAGLPDVGAAAIFAVEASG